MKILFVKGDSGGCGFYRADEPARVLRLLGHDVEVTTQLPADAYVTRSGDMVIERITADADVIVVQRPTKKTIAAAFATAHRHGVKMIADLDDDLERIDRLNMAYYAVDPRYSPDSNWKWLKISCEYAFKLTVSTPALQRYAAPGGSVVVRNAVPEWVTQLPREKRERPRLGWTGTVATHPRDLLQVSGIMGRLLDETGAELVLIGEKDGVKDALNLDEEPTHVEWLDSVEDYLRALTALDVGIVPLDSSSFNQAKSALKGMEMAAAGAPAVASATSEYHRLFSEGACLTAGRPRVWLTHLRKLLTDTDYRESLSESMRLTIQKLHTTEQRAEEWDTALRW